MHHVSYSETRTNALNYLHLNTDQGGRWEHRDVTWNNWNRVPIEPAVSHNLPRPIRSRAVTEWALSFPEADLLLESRL